MMRHAVLMGDPACFRIKHGLNPYTRTRWGFRKRVCRAKAIRQWNNLKQVLEALGAEVIVLAPEKDFTGVVFPANGGFVFPLYEEVPFSKKCFYLSNLFSHRAREQKIYARKLSSFGFLVDTLPFTFEGEADFFPCSDKYIFSYGEIRKVGFRPKWGWPPYRFQYSHRSDARNRESLEEIVGNGRIVEVRLTDERYYHGDTALFSFGRKREYLMAYLDAMDAESAGRLKSWLGDRLISLSRQDAERFVANSFQVFTEKGPHLVLPERASDEIKAKVTSLGFPFVTVDVAEFFSKGGGSIKCMLCDLGPHRENDR